MNQQTGWMHQAEKGANWGIRILVFLCTKFGRRAGRLLLPFIAFYYFIFSSSARQASRTYLARLHQVDRVSWKSIYGHLLCFARVTLDRVFFALGKIDNFQVTFHGEERLRELRATNQGALLLLSHLGSFEAGRCLCESQALAVNILGYFRNAQRINQTLNKLNPQLDTRFIDLTPDSIDFIFQVEKHIEAGELVATMGDRVGTDGKALPANFLGAPAWFPTGPYQIASVLGCPIFLIFVLYHEPNRYDLYCELFAQKITLPRENREKMLGELVQGYASRLEHHCRMADDNWFNFYDFWGTNHE